MNYYNEFDPFCVEWLCNLKAAGHIPEGVVDGRSITEVQPADLVEYRQWHFFAGISGWSEALRLAGWEPDKEVFTFSCPCQPYSLAGKGKGDADARNLWPEARRIVRELRPAVCFGEQTQSPGGLRWFSGVRSDLEELGYSVGASDLCAAGVAAPHKRQRIYFGAIRLADAKHDSGCAKHVRESRERKSSETDSAECSGSCGLADSENSYGRCRECGTKTGAWSHKQRRVRPRVSGVTDRMGDSVSARLEGHSGNADEGSQSGRVRAPEAGSIAEAGPWVNSTIIDCLDGKKRRLSATDVPLAARLPRSLGFLQPEIRRMATGARRNRKGRLKGYGNSIVPHLGALFIRAFMDSVENISRIV